MENLKLDIVLKDTPIEYGLDRESIVELYETSGLNKFIAEILDDVDRENPDHIYQFGKLNICLGR